MTYHILNIILCTAGAALSLWMPGVDGGALIVLYALTWTVFVGCAGYWVVRIFDDLDQRAEDAQVSDMIDTLEVAGVYSPEQAAGVRRDLLEQ